MGLFDPDVIRAKLKGLLGDMPLVQMAQGRTPPVTQDGLLGALRAMPIGPDPQAAYDAALNVGPMLMGKIVYHGSPHKFDKFDASKIGTGEGAQAYGHGVYLADAENVAKEYAGANAGRAAAKSGFLETLPPGAQVDVMKILNQKTRGPLARAQLERVKGRLTPEQYSAVVKEFDAGGALYKADLPDEWIPKMLDWDKPLKELPPMIQQNIYNGLVDSGIDKGIVNHILNNKTGQELMNEIGGRLSVRAPSPASGSEQASSFLRKAGIPGIRYLDGGSRPNAGRISMLEQTISNLRNKGSSQAAIANAQRELDAELARSSYNYVVFPGMEDQVKILERNGVPLTGLLGK